MTERKCAEEQRFNLEKQLLHARKHYVYLEISDTRLDTLQSLFSTCYAYLLGIQPE